MLAKLYEDKITGDIDDETYKLLTNIFKKERGDNRQKCQQLQEAINKIRERRMVLHKLIDYISVYLAVRNGKEYAQKFEIHYLWIEQMELEKSSVTQR